MIITINIPSGSPCNHYIKFNTHGIVTKHSIRHFVFGKFELIVYFDDNRYVSIDFVRDVVKFDVSVGYQFFVDHYSHFRYDGRYIFECSEIDLFNQKDIPSEIDLYDWD